MHKRDKLFFAAGIISFIFSVLLWFSGSKDAAVFVGIWVPSIFSAGILLNQAERHHTKETDAKDYTYS